MPDRFVFFEDVRPLASGAVSYSSAKFDAGVTNLSARSGGRFIARATPPRGRLLILFFVTYASAYRRRGIGDPAFSRRVSVNHAIPAGKFMKYRRKVSGSGHSRARPRGLKELIVFAKLIAVALQKAAARFPR